MKQVFTYKDWQDDKCSFAELNPKTLKEVFDGTNDVEFIKIESGETLVASAEGFSGVYNKQGRPMGFQTGDIQPGTEEDFKSLCAKYINL